MILLTAVTLTLWQLPFTSSEDRWKEIKCFTKVSWYSLVYCIIVMINHGYSL